ncbi:MAG: DoxX family protein [Gammaproteobacteria bacterium]|nr:DoxX family protein [Gammaproteobacteria bacterium]
MNIFVSLGCKFTQFLNLLGNYLSPLGLRLLLAWEFWDSGVTKLRGENWFAQIQDKFPFPFDQIPVDINWLLATWSELIGSIALVIGLATRFSAAALIILDVVAWISVHAGNGYNVCDNGYKLPLIFLIMLIPLLLSGPGKASIDNLIVNRYFRSV